MMRRALGLLLLAMATGCIRPPGPAEEAGDAAREFNATARFGDLGAVIAMASTSLREDLATRHSEWGKDVRVVDMELTGITMEGREHANIVVDFSWTRLNEGTLKTTRVLQVWKNDTGDWLLTREKRVAGDVGLFGEPVASLEPAEPHRDVHFETRVIR